MKTKDLLPLVFSSRMRVRLPSLDFLVWADEEWLGGPFRMFVSDRHVNGLALVTDRRLDILSFFSDQEGRGYFRDFMTEAKVRFDVIGIWHIMNPDLDKILPRYGFKRAQHTFSSGHAHGYEWRRP